MGEKKFSADSNKSIVISNDIQQLIKTIEKYFPSSKKEENANNNRYELIKYLFESLEDQKIDSDVFQLLFDVINKEFPLLSDDNNTMISLAAEKLKKRNELLGKLSEISVITDSKKNQAAQKQYFNTVKKMMNAYKSKFLGTNKIISEDKDENKNEKKKLTLESLIRMTILAQVKLSPQPTESKVKYKDIVELTDIIEKSFHSDSENDKNNRYDLIKCLFEQFSVVKDFLLPCNKMLDGIKAFASNNKTEALSQGIGIFKNMFTGQKQITDFFTPAKESVEKTEETKDEISEIKNTQEKPENKSETEKNKKAGNNILSYKDILPSEIAGAVADYNKKLEKDQVDKKFDLDTQILNDIKKHNVIKKISKLNEIINVDKDNEKNPVISIFKFLSDKKFDLNSFLSKFQNNYLNTVVNLINLGSKLLDQFITKQDVIKETGELFKPVDKNKSKNDKFNQSFVYNSRLKSINELIISNLIQQGIKKVVENLDKFFVKSFKDEKDENDENKDLINKEHQCNISQNKIDEVSKKITGVLLKKFGSVYGLLSKIKNVAEDVGKNKKYNTTASAIFDFVLDCINDEDSEDVSLLPLLLELIDAFNFGDLKIEKDSAQSKKIVYNIINSFMGLIAFSKALNCDTEIFANDKNINNETKITGKLIGLLEKMVDTKEFKGFVGKFLSDEYIEKIKQLLNDVNELKFEDCAYLLCSNEILAQNKENKKENEKSEEKKAENTINIINVENDKDELLNNKNSIKEENEKESKLDIILNQTAMFSWLHKNEKGGKTFFNLTKSLSDKKKIEDFEQYKKEQIKNDQEKENIAKNESVIENKNNNEMKNEMNENKIDINIKNEIENNSVVKHDNTNSSIQLNNIEENNGQMNKNNNMTKLENNNNPTKKEIDNKLNNKDRFNTIRDLFSECKKDEHENKDISGKKVQERKGSFTNKTYKNKFSLGQENEKTTDNQIKIDNKNTGDNEGSNIQNKIKKEDKVLNEDINNIKQDIINKKDNNVNSNIKTGKILIENNTDKDSKNENTIRNIETIIVDQKKTTSLTALSERPVSKL